MFYNDSIDKQLNIAIGDTKYTNEDISSESAELIERLCSQESLRFGSCEASVFKVKVLNSTLSHKGKTMVVSSTLSGETTPYPIGTYKVESDKPTADRKYRDIIAYDAMYDIINADVAAWYNSILPNKDSTVTLKEFRTSFLAYFGIEQEDVTLINDDMVVQKTIEPTELSGKVVITAICEINGCFGHIGRDGKFQYIFLKEMKEGVYPSDTLYPRDDLYPSDPMNVETINKSYYINANYEDFVTAKITKLQIRQEENDIGRIWPDDKLNEGDNCYIVQDNFLVYGKSHEELGVIAANLYSVICKVWYRPAHVEAKGNPCLEVGDGIKLRTKYEIVYTYILQRTLRGIQALRDTYDAEGTQNQEEKVNDVNTSIIQLKGKTNILTRTVEETRLEMADIENNLSAQIAINAQQILLKVSRDGIISSINQTAEKIKIQAQKIDLVGLVEAEEFVSKYATLYTLNATKSELQEAIIERATIGELEVQKLRVNDLEGEIEKIAANYITAGTVSAKYATIYSVENVESTIKRLLNDRMQVIGYFGLLGDFVFRNTSVEWGTVNGVRVLVAAD